MTDSLFKRDIIYIDLDALLDTRLGTLAMMDEQFAFNAMKKGYFKREVDAFPDVDQEAFKIFYAQRNVETLKRSVLTNIIMLLQSFHKSSIEDFVLGGQNTGIEICVNTYPYSLSQEERQAILKMIQVKLGDEVEMSAILIDNAALTPMHCRTNYAAMIRYSFHEWMEIHVEEWKTVTMPNVAFYAPQLFAKVPTPADIRRFKEEKLHPFQATEAICAPMFALRLLSIEMFCIHDSIRAARGATSSTA